MSDSTRQSWDMLSYWLATHGIPSDVDEDVSDSYESDPWRPAPDTEVVRVTLTLKDAATLATRLAERQDPIVIGTPHNDCDHRERYTALDGQDRCDRCAKLDAGWTACPAFVNPPCAELMAPGADGCHRHPGAVTSEMGLAEGQDT